MAEGSEGGCDAKIVHTSDFQGMTPAVDVCWVGQFCSDHGASVQLVLRNKSEGRLVPVLCFKPSELRKLAVLAAAAADWLEAERGRPDRKPAPNPQGG